MMVVSANVASPGSSERPGNPDRIFDSNNSLDVTRLEEQKTGGSLLPHEYHIYTQIVADKLDAVTATKNCSPFTALLATIVKPGFDEYGHRKPVDFGKLTCVIRSLSKELGRMDQQAFNPIIMKVLEFNQWSRLHSALTNAYLQFFNVLVSVNPKWWVEVASKVIKEFSAGLEYDFTAHHLAIKNIMSNVPISGTAFSALFSEHFPHKSSSSNEIQSFIKQLLEISKYAPDQSSAIWRLVISRLVEIDVECECDSDSEVDSESSDSDSDGYSESDSESGLDYSDTSDLEEDNTDGDENLGAPESKRMRIDDVNEGEEVTAVELGLLGSQEPMLQKADDVMTLVLQALSVEFTHDRIVSGKATPLYNILMQMFKEIVLPTSRPHSVQFLWFYIVHGHPDLLASFISVLLETAMSRSYSVDQRCRALQYVASFVARAKGLSRQQTVFVVSFLATWIKRYVREREVEVENATSMAKFKVLYSAVQALFYIFVFKHNILRADEKLGSASDMVLQAGTAIPSPVHSGLSAWEADLDKLFPEIINTKFNPLQYCQPDVVAMFARIAQNEEVASCYSIIERNRWGKFRGSGTDLKAKTGASYGLFDSNRDSKLYDSFFPFQPLKLRRAKLFIGDIYERWSEQDSSSESESDYEM